MALTDEDKAWLAERFDATDRRLDAIERRLDAVEKDLNQLKDYTLQFRAEVIRRFDAVEPRLDVLGTAFNSINIQPTIQPLTKGMIDMGSVVSQLAGAQQISSGRQFEFEKRITKLEEQVAKLTPAA